MQWWVFEGFPQVLAGLGQCKAGSLKGFPGVCKSCSMQWWVFEGFPVCKVKSSQSWVFEGFLLSYSSQITAMVGLLGLSVMIQLEHCNGGPLKGFPLNCMGS